MKKNSKSILILVTLLFFLLYYLWNASYMIDCFLDYTKLFLTKLFPVQFSFFLLSSLLLDYGILEIFLSGFSKNTGSLYVFLFSLLSGFPSGANYTKELLEKGVIDIKEGNQILRFSHFPNPLFILGSVSSLLGDRELAFKIFLAIFASNFFLFLISKKEKVSTSTFSYTPPSNFSISLSNAILSSIRTILLIYGTSIFFYLFSILFTSSFSFHPYFFVFLNGLFDLTKGVFTTSILSNTLLRAFYILFFLSFGGVSVHMQVRSILSNTSLSYFSFFKGRIWGTLLSFSFFFLFLTI